ncbi:MAG: J domain-containing protein [Treponema sp.]|nr:J domain-containing protein [Treponema sp.]
MENCYEILGVNQNASAVEIKRAFRQKAKQYHPDTAQGNSAEATARFRQLVRAYDILSDARQRSIFDNSFFAKFHVRQHSKDTFDYHAWLMQRDDDESRAKLIFWDVMHHRENEAVEEYKRMATSRPDFNLRNWFTYKDFMDYGYILAEELTVRGEFYDAFLLLEEIIKMEKKYNYFRIFFPEVISFTLHILKHNIDGNVSDELALDAWERALDLGFSSHDDAFFLKKIAVVYTRMGDARTANICLAESARLSGKDIRQPQKNHESEFFEIPMNASRCN